MRNKKYTEKEKLAHLEKAKANIEKGIGTFNSYATDWGISRSSIYKWAHAFGYNEKDNTSNESSSNLVNLGKPVQQRLPEKQKFVVNYYGASIEVSSQSNLVALLKGIRTAESI